MSANCKSCSSNSNMSKTLPNQCSCKQEGNVDIPLTPITPYPDEVLTSLLDRLIQLLHRICSPNKSKPNKKLSTGNLNLCTSVSKTVSNKESTPHCKTSCSTKASSTKVNSKTSVTSANNNKSVKTILPPVPNQKKNLISATSKSNKKIANKTAIGVGHRGLLKRSYSLCSLACRKMKSMFSSGSAYNSGSAKWLWTKERKDDDKCQVYEVFKNSTISSHPTQFDNPSAARIIFIILPTGIIMPFETVNDTKPKK